MQTGNYVRQARVRPLLEWSMRVDQLNDIRPRWHTAEVEEPEVESLGQEIDSESADMGMVFD